MFHSLSRQADGLCMNHYNSETPCALDKSNRSTIPWTHLSMDALWIESVRLPLESYRATNKELFPLKLALVPFNTHTVTRCYSVGTLQQHIQTLLRIWPFIVSCTPYNTPTNSSKNALTRLFLDIYARLPIILLARCSIWKLGKATT